MELSVYFQEDISRVLQALAVVGEGRHPEYFVALRAVALAFGIRWEGPGAKVIEHRHAPCATNTTPQSHD